jgi:hypothetical protein
LLIQFLNVSDFRTKPPYFFAKHFEVIHSNRIAYLGTPSMRHRLARELR